MLRRAMVIVLVAYCAFGTVVLLWPTPVDAPLQGALPAPTPGALDNPPLWRSYEWIEFGANVALFTPLGVLGGLLLPRSATLPLIGAAAAGSVVFEFAQHVLLADRTASLFDVLANTLGAAIGALVARHPTLRNATSRRR